MRAFILSLCAVVLVMSGCAAMTEVSKIGNEYAQHSYSRNFWWPNYDRVQTVSLTPDVQGDVWIGGYWSFDRNSSGNMANQRIQVDGSDQPSGQTAAAYDFRRGSDGTDEDPMMISTSVTNMTAAAHTIDLDGSVNATTGTPDAETATLWAVTMELAATSSTARNLMLMGVGQ